MTIHCAVTDDMCEEGISLHAIFSSREMAEEFISKTDYKAYLDIPWIKGACRLANA